MKERVLFGADQPLAIAFAKIWARQGDRLTLIGSKAHSLAELAKDLQARGASNIEIVELDFANLKEVRRHAVELFKEKLKIETLVLVQEAGPVTALPDSEAFATELTRAMTINYCSAAVILAAARDNFLRSASGTIAGLSSPGGEGWITDIDALGSSRAAVSNLLESYRKQLTPAGVRVSTMVLSSRGAVEVAALDLAVKIGSSEMACGGAFSWFTFALNRFFPLKIRSKWFSALP
jgi:decaprenylphospho-beta-D-erythro-pentofuranosid-2-ulose 2-reductase